MTHATPTRAPSWSVALALFSVIDAPETTRAFWWCSLPVPESVAAAAPGARMNSRSLSTPTLDDAWCPLDARGSVTASTLPGRALPGHWSNHHGRRHTVTVLQLARLGDGFHRLRDHHGRQAGASRSRPLASPSPGLWPRPSTTSRTRPAARVRDRLPGRSSAGADTVADAAGLAAPDQTHQQSLTGATPCRRCWWRSRRTAPVSGGVIHMSSASV
ncbi:hypothetical protein QJS66_00170 [Kocuria rhizophila]|nr:hypothetical protein QJS66_00170 [Kocuria rhizophila]